jgi:hypothetical protein
MATKEDKSTRKVVSQPLVKVTPEPVGFCLELMVDEFLSHKGTKARRNTKTPKETLRAFHVSSPFRLCDLCASVRVIFLHPTSRPHAGAGWLLPGVNGR